jgi:hypothetical protein
MPPPASTTPVNLHGRKPTRGLRPWLLIPKVLVVGCVLGAAVTDALAANWARAFAVAGELDYAGHDLLLVKRLFTHGVEPAVAAAAILGLFLFLQHPGVFLRQRWWQAKLATLAATGLLSLWLSPRLRALNPGSPTALWRQVAAGQCGLIVLTICVIVLGRLKPRLGQTRARDAAVPTAGLLQGTPP